VLPGLPGTDFDTDVVEWESIGRETAATKASRILTKLRRHRSTSQVPRKSKIPHRNRVKKGPTLSMQEEQW